MIKSRIDKQTKKDIIKRIVIGILLLVLCACSLYAFTITDVNYTLIDYLPASSNTAKGFAKVTEEFGSASYARIMISDIDIRTAGEVKEQITKVEGVGYTLWLSDLINMVIEPVKEKLNQSSDEIEELIQGLGLSDDSGVQEFLQLVKTGASTNSILEFLDKNPIILGAIDLVIDYYFDGAINLSNYYDSTNKCALIEVYFAESDYSTATDNAIDEIQTICSFFSAYYDGTAIAAKTARETTTSEIVSIIIFVVPLALIILILATTSYLHPLILLLTIGISVLLNMGTNFIFQLIFINGQPLLNGISFITNSMTAALQMAISMDYAIFIVHKYEDALEETGDAKQARILAVKRSILPIASSCLTTVAGFVAISLMDFGIGMDIGLVFAKGIIISFVVSLVCMPFFIGAFGRLIEKTKHRPLMPKGVKLAKFCVKFSIPIIIVVVLLGGFCYTLQDGESDINFVFGESAISASEGTRSYEDERTIEDIFGRYNPLLIVVNKNLREENASGELKDTDRESIIINEIRHLNVTGTNNVSKNIVGSIMSYRSLYKPALAEIIPQQLIDNFDSENYTRIMVNVDANPESAQSFDAYSKIMEILKRNAGTDWYITGSTVAAFEMREILQGNNAVLFGERDYQFVNILAIIAVFAIIAVTFKSLILPLLLVATIELGIFINMAFTALSGTSAAFLGYMIVSLIQLGATIDYAILYTQNYIESRQTSNKNVATFEAIKKSITSIITSAGILSVAGFAIWLTSSVQGVADIGLMIGRGALISGILTLCFLPPLLRLCDKYIPLLSLKMKFCQVEKIQVDEEAVKEIDMHLKNGDTKTATESQLLATVLQEDNQQADEEEINISESSEENGTNKK